MTRRTRYTSKNRRTSKRGGSPSYRKSLQTAKLNEQEAKWCGNKTKKELKKEYDKIKIKMINKNKIKTLVGCYKKKIAEEEKEITHNLVEEWKEKNKHRSIKINTHRSIKIKAPSSPTHMSASYSTGSFKKATSPNSKKRRAERVQATMQAHMQKIENPPKKRPTSFEGKPFDKLQGDYKRLSNKKSGSYNRLHRPTSASTSASASASASSHGSEPIPLALFDP